MDDDRMRDQRQRLLARARELGSEVDAVEGDREGALAQARDTVEDLGDQGEDARRDEVSAAEQARDLVELRAIEAALDRMDRGTYGRCIDCGQNIPMARLTAQPTALRCVQCQERAESRAAR